MDNLSYLQEKTKDLSPARKDSINAYLVGAASVLIDDEKAWQRIVDNAMAFFENALREAEMNALQR